MSTNYDYIHESDVNRLAYLMCDLMDCRKCPVGYGHKCAEELKEWLKKPLGNLRYTEVCPDCGKRVAIETLLSYPPKFQARCDCRKTDVSCSAEDAIEEWRRTRHLKTLRKS